VKEHRRCTNKEDKQKNTRKTQRALLRNARKLVAHRGAYKLASKDFPMGFNTRRKQKEAHGENTGK